VNTASGPMPAMPGPPDAGGASWPVECDRAGSGLVFQPMSEGDLDAVHDTEKQAYAHPWSRKHFADSLAAGYPAVMLLGEARPEDSQRLPVADERVLLAYLVAMVGVDEVHLLNLTVAPAHQGQGWGRLMLDALCLWSRGQSAQWLWLEVRAGNAGARRLYERYGFRPVGVRRAYYPAEHQRREDAVVMSLHLQSRPTDTRP
jgi:[ribosomal protein S18]-alanine N-acetyltransferase